MADEFDPNWRVRMPPKSSQPVTLIARYVGHRPPRPFQAVGEDNEMAALADETTPAPLSDAEIREIEGRELNAMAGPWDSSDRIGVGDSIELYDGEYVLKGAGDETLGFVYADPDADFIAHARTDIPRLLATLAAYREIVAAVALQHEMDASITATLRVAIEDIQEFVVAHAYDTTVGHKIDDFITERARALLASTQTPATGATAGEEGEA